MGNISTICGTKNIYTTACMQISSSHLTKNVNLQLIGLHDINLDESYSHRMSLSHSHNNTTGNKTQQILMSLPISVHIPIASTDFPVHVIAPVCPLVLPFPVTSVSVSLSSNR